MLSWYHFCFIFLVVIKDQSNSDFPYHFHTEMMEMSLGNEKGLHGSPFSPILLITTSPFHIYQFCAILNVNTYMYAYQIDPAEL